MMLTKVGERGLEVDWDGVAKSAALSSVKLRIRYDDSED